MKNEKQDGDKKNNRKLNTKQKKRSRPISLHPLTPEQALSAFMETPVKKKKSKKNKKKRDS